MITFTLDLTKPLPKDIFCFPSAVKPEALLFRVFVSSNISAISFTLPSISTSVIPRFLRGNAKFSYTVIVS